MVRRTLTPIAPDITLIVLEHPSREPQGPLGEQKAIGEVADATTKNPPAPCQPSQ